MSAKAFNILVVEHTSHGSAASPNFALPYHSKYRSSRRPVLQRCQLSRMSARIPTIFLIVAADQQCCKEFLHAHLRLSATQLEEPSTILLQSWHWRIEYVMLPGREMIWSHPVFIFPWLVSCLGEVVTGLTQHT